MQLLGQRGLLRSMRRRRWLYRLRRCRWLLSLRWLLRRCALHRWLRDHLRLLTLLLRLLLLTLLALHRLTLLRLCFCAHAHSLLLRCLIRRRCSWCTGQAVGARLTRERRRAWRG